jgi:hypothetical protein
VTTSVGQDTQTKNVQRKSHLIRQQVRGDGGVGSKDGRQEHTHVTNVDGDVQIVQHAVDGGSSGHQARVNGATDDTAQWVPCTVIKPIQKVVETFRGEVLRGPVVEPGVELVNHLQTPRGEGAFTGNLSDRLPLDNSGTLPRNTIKTG